MALSASLALSACGDSEPSEEPLVEPQSDQTAAPQPEPVNEAEQIWANWSLEEQAASLLVLHYPGVDTTMTEDFLTEISPAGLILMGDNIPDPEESLTQQIDTWQNENRNSGQPPLIISIDQEGGLVRRLDGDPGQGPDELRDGDASSVHEAFAVRGEYLASLGINMNFGVVADTTADPSSFIHSRVLGTTPEHASEGVQAAVQGEQEGSGGQVLSTIKHFPGHGITSGDTHEVLASCGELTAEEWRNGPAQPFVAGIDAGTPLVMVGHMVCGFASDEPATISPQWYDILREELGFDGVIVTDDLSMLTQVGEPSLADPVANAIAAINAGTTLVLSIGGIDGSGATEYAHALVDGIAAAVESGEIPTEVFEDAGMRALELRLNLGW